MRHKHQITVVQFCPLTINERFYCAVVAAIAGQSNTGNGSKIYFAACLAVAQIERCCAVLGRDTNWAISQQICMPEMENQTYTDLKCLKSITNQLATSLSFLHDSTAGILRVIGCYNQLVTIKLMLNSSVARQWTAVQCNIAFRGTFSALYLLLATVSTSETTAPVSTRSVSTMCWLSSALPPPSEY